MSKSAQNASAKKIGMFQLPDGKSLGFTFALVSSLFLLWGFCNGMIDTMDKHFQDQLHLTKAQSAWVQFAHYMGYSLMALPAGLLTRRFGYKGGIIFGLLLVSVGGFWFLPATSISQFWAFLLGVSLIAMGLTVLETVANPYTTVLGPQEFAASRINLAQSCNGVGWILGPIAGSMFFYSEGGVQKAHGQLFIPYLGVAILVVILAALFSRAPVPEINVADQYHTDDSASVNENKSTVLVGSMMFLNVAAVGLSVYLILHTILPACGIAEKTVTSHWWIFALPILLLAPMVFSSAKKLSTHSIWAHPHFSGATLAQFLYVAAQAGIFSFFINSMTVDKNTGFCMVPTLSASVGNGFLQEHGWVEHRVALAPGDIIDLSGLAKRLQAPDDPVARFIHENLSDDTRALLEKGDSAALSAGLLSDLNDILRQELSGHDPKAPLYDEQRFSQVKFSEATQALLAEKPATDNARLRLNRMLLADAFPNMIAYNDASFAISDKGASLLSSLAFGCFLLGRLVGAWVMKKASVHKTLGMFALINVLVCGLIIANLGWLSVAGVFLSYLFMSIMFPTIFALGIFGIGSQSKKKAAAFIVMSITGGALMPKFMGHLGDVYNMAASFWMPLVCFVLIALYAFSWTKLSRAKGLRGMNSTGAH